MVLVQMALEAPQGFTTLPRQVVVAAVAAGLLEPVPPGLLFRPDHLVVMAALPVAVAVAGLTKFASFVHAIQLLLLPLVVMARPVVFVLFGRGQLVLSRQRMSHKE